MGYVVQYISCCMEATWNFKRLQIRKTRKSFNQRFLSKGLRVKTQELHSFQMCIHLGVPVQTDSHTCNVAVSGLQLLTSCDCNYLFIYAQKQYVHVISALPKCAYAFINYIHMTLIMCMSVCGHIYPQTVASLYQMHITYVLDKCAYICRHICVDTCSYWYAAALRKTIQAFQCMYVDVGPCPKDNTSISMHECGPVHMGQAYMCICILLLLYCMQT